MSRCQHHTALWPVLMRRVIPDKADRGHQRPGVSKWFVLAAGVVPAANEKNVGSWHRETPRRGELSRVPAGAHYAIKKLEALLGNPLFHRDGRQISLTEFEGALKRICGRSWSRCLPRKLSQRTSAARSGACADRRDDQRQPDADRPSPGCLQATLADGRSHHSR